MRKNSARMRNSNGHKRRQKVAKNLLLSHTLTDLHLDRRLPVLTYAIVVTSNALKRP